METVKCKKTNIAVLVLIFLFFFVACSFAQVERMITLDKDGKEVVTRYSSYTWNVILNDKEYIELNIKSDSIDSEAITLALYAHFPKNVSPKGTDISIVYMDGTTDLFKQSLYSLKGGYAEYKPTNNINNIATKLVKSISFKGITQTEDSKEGDVYFKYFISFL